MKLKKKFTSTLILTLLEYNKGFMVYYDEYRVGLSCVLRKHRKVISYSSRQLKVHVRNYPTHGLEILAVVFSLKIWWHYLYGVHVDIFCNHKSIKYVFTQKEQNLIQSR